MLYEVITDYIQIKDLMNILDKDEMDNLLLDYQKYSWDRRSTFCGVCGSKTEYDEKENCKICVITSYSIHYTKLYENKCGEFNSSSVNDAVQIIYKDLEQDIKMNEIPLLGIGVGIPGQVNTVKNRVLKTDICS